MERYNLTNGKLGNSIIHKEYVLLHWKLCYQCSYICVQTSTTL